MDHKLRFLLKLGVTAFFVNTLKYISGPVKKIESKPCVLLGIENFVRVPEKFAQITHGKMGLICNQNSFDQRGNRSLDLLLRAGLNIKKVVVLHQDDGQNIRKVFPQYHGFDVYSNLPIYFIDIRKKNMTFGNVVNDLDVIGVDLPVRGFCGDPTENFVKQLLTVAAKKGKSVVIFDRPNPRGGVIAGRGDIPWRYGLTIGELATYYQRFVVQKNGQVCVVPMVGWVRDIGVPLALKDCFRDGNCIQQINKKTEKSLTSFFAQSKYCCLYNPLPVVIKYEHNKG